jgi:hypothetical protein
MIALLLIFLGYYKDNYVLQVIGFTFIFLLAFQFYDTGIDYTTGSTYNWTINQTVNNATSTNYLMMAVESMDNGNYTNTTISIFFMFLGLIGFVSVFFNMKGSIKGG